MGITQLSSIEIQDLINRYQSELKKLNFQINEVEETIYELESLRGVVEEKEKSVLGSRVRKSRISGESKPAGAKPALKTGKRRGRPPKSTVQKSQPTPEQSTEASDKKGYKLSPWDEAVIQSLTESGKAMITSEIVDQTAQIAASSGLSNDREEVKKKVVRSLQKLVNRRGDLHKVKFKGKGFAYSLPDWVSAKGRLLKEYKR